MKNIKIDENIANLRKKMGLTQDELANQLGVSNQAVSKWESGKCCPDIELLPNLACLFGVSIDELLLGKSLIDTNSKKMNDDYVLEVNKILNEKGYISTSLLQRMLKIGYGKAKKIIDDMCQDEIIIKDPTCQNRYILSDS